MSTAKHSSISIILLYFFISLGRLYSTDHIVSFQQVGVEENGNAFFIHDAEVFGERMALLSENIGSHEILLRVYKLESGTPNTQSEAELSIRLFELPESLLVESVLADTLYVICTYQSVLHTEIIPVSLSESTENGVSLIRHPSRSVPITGGSLVAARYFHGTNTRFIVLENSEAYAIVALERDTSRYIVRERRIDNGEISVMSYFKSPRLIVRESSIAGIGFTSIGYGENGLYLEAENEFWNHEIAYELVAGNEQHMLLLDITGAYSLATVNSAMDLTTSSLPQNVSPAGLAVNDGALRIIETDELIDDISIPGKPQLLDWREGIYATYSDSRVIWVNDSTGEIIRSWEVGNSMPFFASVVSSERIVLAYRESNSTIRFIDGNRDGNDLNISFTIENRLADIDRYLSSSLSAQYPYWDPQGYLNMLYLVRSVDVLSDGLRYWVRTDGRIYTVQ